MSEESIINSVPAYYKDSLNLNSLQYNNNISDEAKLKEVGIQFESILLRQFLDESLKNLFTGMDGEQAPGSDVYKGMIIDQLADSISRTNQTGMAEMYSDQLRQVVSAIKSPSEKKPALSSMLSEEQEESTQKPKESEKIENTIESIHQQFNLFES